MKLALSVIIFMFTGIMLHGQVAVSEPAPAVEAPAVVAPGQGDDAAPAAGAQPSETVNEVVSPSAEPSVTPQPPPMTEQDLVKDMTARLSDLVSRLSQVRSAAAAAESAAEVSQKMNELFSVDYSQYEDVDEEVVAAHLTDLFNDLELQVSRLYEADFYGNAILRKTFGAEEEPFSPPPGKDDVEPLNEEEMGEDLQLDEPD